MNRLRPGKPLSIRLRDVGRAGADPARDAAEEAASYENRFAAIETRLERIATEIAFRRWMIALLLASVFFPYVRALFIAVPAS